MISYDPDLRCYFLGIIKSEYYFKKDRNNYKHCRDVEWNHTPAARDMLSTGVKNALGSILTLFELSSSVLSEIEAQLHIEISDEEWEKMEAEFEEVQKDEQHSLMEDAVARSTEFIKDKLFTLTSEQMEELVAGILRAMGYKTQMTPKTRDRGSDIFASPDGLGMIEPRIRVEVKHQARSKKKVGTEEIRNFIGGMRDHHNGIFVSTTGFSLEAKYEVDRATFQITMIDGDRLVELLLEYYEAMDPETKAIIPLKKVYWPV